MKPCFLLALQNARMALGLKWHTQHVIFLSAVTFIFCSLVYDAASAGYRCGLVSSERMRMNEGIELGVEATYTCLI